MQKQLWMLVGGNGAGKSTFYQQILAPLGMPFINADLIAREVYPDNPEANSYNAARLAEAMRMEALQDGKSFCFETVFSHPSKIDFIAQAKALGYSIVLVFIHVDDVMLNKARVKHRAHDGGHDVPEDKITSRIPRTLENVKSALPLCDEVRVLDNSSLEKPFRQVLSFRQGVAKSLVSPLPQWAEFLLL
jgi:predicted ABC-type ATPase